MLAPPAAPSAACDEEFDKSSAGFDCASSCTSLAGAFDVFVVRGVPAIGSPVTFWSAFVSSRCLFAALLASTSVDCESQSVATSLSRSCLQAAPMKVSSTSRCKAEQCACHALAPPWGQASRASRGPSWKTVGNVGNVVFEHQKLDPVTTESRLSALGTQGQRVQHKLQQHHCTR